MILPTLAPFVLPLIAGYALGILARPGGAVRKLRVEIDQLRVQLMACGVAALGWGTGANDVEPTDLCWSASLGDVVKLRETYEHTRRALNRLVFVARTSGGTAGPDFALMAACDAAEQALEPKPTTSNTGSAP